MPNKNSLIALAITMALAAALPGCKQPEIKGVPDAQGLAEVEHSGMDAVRANPTVNFAKYTSIVIDDIGFTQLKITQPLDSSARYEKFTLDDKDFAELRAGYRRQVTEVLTDSGAFRVIENASAGATDTLRLQTEMTRLEPTAPREKDAVGVGSARDKTFTRGAGSMTLVARLIDVRSGQTVVTLRDEVADDESWSQNNPVFNRGAILRGFTNWGYGVRRQLQALAAPKQQQ
ncbi:MAG TPA: DUF3313 family protein [Spongiibacteraceae bacterium]|nr:DUF3313 family protein [Spongiibacteraceae bacterium]